MIDKSICQVVPCRCNSKDCFYKLQWEEAGSPSIIPLDVAMGKQYIPLVSEWLVTKSCNRRGEQSNLKF